MSRFNDLSRMCRKLQLLAKPGLCAVATAVALACLVPVAHAQAQASGEHEVRDIRSLNATEKKQLLEQIRARLREVFDSAKPFPGQVAFVPRKLEFRTEARNEVLVIDLGPMDGPQLRDADMSELSELSAQLDGTIADFLHELGISYPIFKHEFDGRDLYYYHPEDKQYQLEYERRMQLKGKQSAIPPQDAKVAISAMHGWYWRVFEQAWPCNGPRGVMGRVTFPAERGFRSSNAQGCTRTAVPAAPTVVNSNRRQRAGASRYRSSRQGGSECPDSLICPGCTGSCNRLRNPACAQWQRH